MQRHYVAPLCLTAALVSLFVCRIGIVSSATFTAKDPGVRPTVSGNPNPGNALPGLTKGQLDFFNASKTEFTGPETVAEGLGPRMNLDSCLGCHAQPAMGGSSPATNPQVAFATSSGFTNRVPSFIKSNGPVREVRYKTNPDGSPDGGVHSLFTVTGSPDVATCNLQQPNFEQQFSAGNVIFRIPTPVFGAGLIEQIPDSAILANQAANSSAKQVLGIRGRPNIVLAGNAISGQANFNGNDGTAARFGWKAQNKSLLLFAGEAYNVEMGITNELFQTERDETPECQAATAKTPNDVSNLDAATMMDGAGGIEKFAAFMRFLAPPAPSTNFPGGAWSIGKGRTLFTAIGCAHCHTPALTTGSSTVAALSNKPVNLFSDLLLHDMGPDLADGISQGQAGPSEFRTAPLWGLGQRIFFLHDGRTSDLIEAIQEHSSGSSRNGNASEANGVISNYNRLGEPDKQNLLNFLRSL
jgi:CxxC motif-containing protein (DUF1111 family)